MLTRLERLRQAVSDALRHLANTVDTCPLHTIGTGRCCRSCEHREAYWAGR
jgi:hypothetical protein